MALAMHKIQLWSADVPDRVGAGAAKLEMLARAGANLELVLTRPSPNNPGNMVVIVAPIIGPEQIQAAQAAGFAPSPGNTMLCVEGKNRTGIGFDLMSRLAVAGLTLQGLSISCVGDRFAAYLAFDDADSVTQAVQVLATMDA
jgi:hypothetical protein